MSTLIDESESASDVLCDRCGCSTSVDGGPAQFGLLSATWSLGSIHAGQTY